MKKLLLFIVLATLCLFFSAETNAANIVSGITQKFNPKQIQDTTKYKIKPLKIGDKVPDELWNMPLQVVNHPEGKKTITLNDYRGKLVILDFWATSCGSCIEAFPKLHLLQKQFIDQLQILLVNSKSTGDHPLKVKKYFEKRRATTGQVVELPYLLTDSVLSLYFPHQYIPHYVWIKAGKIHAVTSSREIDSSIISSTLKGSLTKIHHKDDMVNFDHKKPLYQNLNQNTAGHLKLSSMVTGYIEGIGVHSGKQVDSSGKITRLYHLNLPLINLFHIAFKKHLNVPDNHILFEVNEPQRFMKNSGDYYANAYGYELIIGGSSFEEAQNYMRQDLSRVFKVTVVTENRLMKVWAIKQNSKIDRLKSRGGDPEFNISKSNINKYLKNQPLIRFIGVLNSISNIPVIDQTSYNGNIDIKLPQKFYELDAIALQNYLKEYGLEMYATEVKMNVAIIKDLNHE